MSLIDLKKKEKENPSYIFTSLKSNYYNLETIKEGRMFEVLPCMHVPSKALKRKPNPWLRFTRL